MKKTLFAADLDGTLLNDSATVAPEYAKILNDMCAEGLLFAAASARSPISIGLALRGTGIVSTAPAVCLNGALLWDMRKNEAAGCFPIDKTAVRDMLAVMHAQPITARVFMLRSGRLETYYRGDTELSDYDRWFNSYMNSSEAPVLPYFGGELPEGQVLSATYCYFTDKLLPIYEALQRVRGIRCVLYANTYRENMSFLELYAENGGKGAGARESARLCGAELLYVFGDNFNDLDMYRVADMSFAPENGEPDMKRIASRIVPSNNEGGIIRTIEEYFRADKRG